MSTPKLQMSETCTVSVGDTESAITVDNSSGSGGFGMGGMFGGGMPEGGENPPEGFQMPENDRNAQNEDDRMPYFDDQESFPGEMQIPDQGTGENEMHGRQRDEGQPIFGRQNQDWRQGGMAAETPALSPGTPVLVGVSILLLLAGILIAVKTKH